jgi:uncharacterized protein (TIGR02596 family)
MTRKSSNPCFLVREPAFSLIELLAVIALLAVLAVMVAPSIRGISSATELTVSGSALVDALNLARQTAQSVNRPVEVRFFEVPRSTDPVPAFRAVGVYVLTDTGPSPVGRMVFLRDNVVMSDTDAFGTLLRGLPAGQTEIPSLEATGKLFNYRSFTFRPDGSANLPRSAPVGGGDSWHVMLYDARKPPAGGTAPENHVTIQLLPESGRTRVYQPGAG